MQISYKYLHMVHPKESDRGELSLFLYFSYNLKYRYLCVFRETV